MSFGDPGAEKVVLNLDSLWAGGPFETSSYMGGNPTSDKSQYLPGIREWIFQNGTGNVSQLLGNEDNYGSYQVFANLSVAIDGITSATKYHRSLDLNTGIHSTVYTTNEGTIYTTNVFCTYPDQVCVYDITSSGDLPEISIAFDNQLTDSSFFNTTCGNRHVRATGVTQLGPPTGMIYDGIAQLIGDNESSHCSNTTSGVLIIPAGSTSRKLSLVIGAGTNYDQKAGNAKSDFSFKGVDPGPYVESVTSAASQRAEKDLRQAHITDYQSHAGQFDLDLPDTAGSADLETSVILGRYALNGTGDPYLESLLFQLGRHLFISSSRENSLPTNLAGRWSETIDAAWSADYHTDINIQMNHWGVDATGLGDLQSPLWEFMQDTWIPQGTNTAKILYGAPGWVGHSFINIFGYTAMGDTASWANIPVEMAWMMQHVYDHFTYSQNVTWLEAQAYPLIRGVAEFWLSQLQEDRFFNDGTLVVNPCNSPEHSPTTFGCTHYQQLIHQLFNSTITLISYLPSPTSSDQTLSSSLTTALKTLDTGLHISTFGTVKEWKLPDTYGYDVPNDTHRHLSHLYGWYPGHSISSLLSGYTNTTIQSAISESLINRGPGLGADANAGWEKVWRSACWALLNNTSEAYYELRFTIAENLAGNGLSMYSGKSKPFQIDANYGFVGAVVAMLVVDLPGKEDVVLGPAIPSAWGNGSVNGLRIRGGGVIDFAWDEDGLVTTATVKGGSASGRKIVNKDGAVLA
ncbi:Alpha-fucosidase A [Lachnellula arida]|uniref:Alpha-fucosidase A n=1 Tax=Lachnellula arida TaxID=1316785 RepID=A0A8T9B108_9HELO|nr:Alpha-fucosidase A [Lachnellula arida]